MYLYKYISGEDALLNIVNGKIKFSTIADLNDPSELIPKVNEQKIIESLNEKRRTGLNEEDKIDLSKQIDLYNRLMQKKVNVNMPNSADELNLLFKSAEPRIINILISHLKETVSIMSENCGVFSLSTRNNSLPMWAHYANNAHGFIVEFKDLNILFKDERTCILDNLQYVKYSENFSNVTFERESYKSIFFGKNKDWEYEQEMRVITSLNECIEEFYEGTKIYTKLIPSKYITKVIFGWNVRSEKIKEISEKIKKINSSVCLDKASVDTGKIVFEKILN